MRERIVAVYARVSTEHEAQLSALENQVQYYENLMSLHPEWKLYQTYIDEGITGTSVKKRKNFLQMMNDAEQGKFDLIITREVSRFARNTVDTLQQTRLLRKWGVEVYFTEDNIWTMNDEDGELRLTIMATLAQNESKKTSMRVKAGQMISFKNGVAYGNGNILGYDRVGKEYVINPEQARTVRMIYDMYLDGMGTRKIQFELEKAGRLTATGLTRWDPANVSRVLNNPFYCGILVYRKQYVPDYLEQKKVNNFGSVDKIVVKGKHEPIVTEEEFYKVKELLESRSVKVENKGSRGLYSSNDVWCKKLKCACGSNMSRRHWRKVKDIPQYAYQCYTQTRTGTIKTRMNKGLSIEGICESPMVPAWKLGAMADIIFQNFWKDRDGVLKIANEMLDKHFMDKRDESFEKEIEDTKQKIEAQNKKFDILVEMRMSGEIDKKMFDEKKNALHEEIERLNKVLASYQIEEGVTEEDYQNKLEVLKYGLEQDFNFSTHSIPDEVIDAFVDKIIVYKDCFVWKLNLYNEDIKIKTDGNKKNLFVSLVESSPSVNDGSTGCYCGKEVMDNNIFISAL